MQPQPLPSPQPAQMPPRRIARGLRRRHVARAYDMAKEILPHLAGARLVVDVGCGNGFIAHHLSALLPATVSGLDVADAREVPIAFSAFDGRRLPLDSASRDGALLCYVLHHSPDPGRLLAEVRRVLAPGGRVVVYEDLPVTWFDRLLCHRHDLAWRARGGAPSFRTAESWRWLFRQQGLRVLHQRSLSRARDLNHPVRRALFVLRRD